MPGELTTTEFWDEYWEGVKLPTAVDPGFAFDRCFSAALVETFANESGTGFEIGCAPGKWLAFLAETCGLKPAGIEYSAGGMAATRKNLELHGVENAEIIDGDFFAREPDARFDAVASYGFVEHFGDPIAVLDRHLGWLKPGGLLVIGVPNFRGIHGTLQKMLDRSIVDKHNLSVMDPAYLSAWAGERGLAVERLGYLGGFEPGLPIVDTSRMNPAIFLARAIMWVGFRVRRSPSLDNLNGPCISSYLLLAARKPEA